MWIVTLASGVNINTSCGLRILELQKKFYIVGQNMLIAANSAGKNKKTKRAWALTSSSGCSERVAREKVGKILVVYGGRAVSRKIE